MMTSYLKPCRAEFSLRLAQADPWIDIEERYPVGCLADGVVTDVEHYGAFVELEPGVIGLVHHSRLPGWENRPLQDVFWPGDRVKVVVSAVDPALRRMDLSTAGLLARRWRPLLEAATEVAETESPEPATSSLGTSLDRLLERPPKTVLIIENDTDQLRAVTDWLRRAGQRTEGLTTAEEAIAQLDAIHPDLLLMDVGLPGLNGIEAAQRVRTEWPWVRCVLMTDWSSAEDHAEALEMLRHEGVALLLKPLQPEDLLGVLLEAPSGKAPGSVTVSPVRTRLERGEWHAPQLQPGRLTSILAQLRSTLRADKVVLFELDPDSRRITVVDDHGPLPIRPAALPGLIHSPVRDAAEDGEVVRACDLAELAGPRFIHLRPLADFSACLGVPAPTELHGHYALFAFFGHPTAITETAIARAEASAAKAAVWLERRQFTKRVADLQRVALLGQVARFLVHEISGGLTYFYMGLDRAQSEHSQIERNATVAPAQVAASAQTVRQVLDDLKQRADSMKTTLRSFSYMARAGQEELLRLDELVGAAVKALGGEAETCHVELAVASPAHRLYFTRAQATFLQQVLVNVILNAIQQIHQLRPRDKGRVLVGMSQTVTAGRSVIQVRVEDDGPGIHRRLWDRVFEMDYSTRADGSGLGLYISRSLIEAQGGRIYVADSHVHWGTTFVVELPFKL